MFEQVGRPRGERVAMTGNATFLPLGETLVRPTLGQTAGGPRGFAESVGWRRRCPTSRSSWQFRAFRINSHIYLK